VPEPVTIAHVIHSLPADGAEQLLLDLVRGTDRSRFRPVVIGVAAGGPLAPEMERAGARVHVAGKRWKLDWSVLGRIAAILEAERAAIVHTHLFTGDVWGRLAGLRARVPVHFSTLHNVTTNETWLARRIQRRLARRVDRVIACSPEVAASYIGAGIVPREKVLTISNGVDTARFRGAPPMAEARAALGLDAARGRVVGVVARLSPQKGHEVFLRAARRVRAAAGAGVQFAIVGDGPLRRSLEEQARALGLGEAVRFLGLRRDIPRVFAALDVVVLPSLWEGLPFVVLEALAAARPLVATAVGGVPAIVHDRVTGRLVPPGDDLALATAILHLLSCPEDARAMAESGRALVERDYSLTTMARKYERAWAEALAQRAVRLARARSARGGGVPPAAPGAEEAGVAWPGRAEA
jgi:glycosyltransferase involved in cell wall biosynthesis